MKKIVLTGGGTAGHVTPNLALLPNLKNDYEVFYIGSKTGIEKELIEKSGMKYYGISSGKMRRYLDLKNITDVFRVVKGVGEAYGVLKKLRPDVVFSKGGFVIVPVVIAAKLLNIPVAIHESDITPGLANKISIPLVKKVCVSFPETLTKIPKDKGILTGTPIRAELFKGSKSAGLKLCGFNSHSKPVILVTGGSQGSVKINTCVRQALPSLLKDYNLIHLCGKGNADFTIKLEGYKQFEYLSEELTHIIAASDIMVSRAGANSIFEILALRKPNLLIPLSKNASRGDQILNAESFKQQGFSKVLPEENMTVQSLVLAINDLYSERKNYIEKMENCNISNGVEKIIETINGMIM